MTVIDLPPLEQSRKNQLTDQFEQQYFHALLETLDTMRNEGVTICPPYPLLFNALNKTPFEHVRVVLLGQDPYHGPGQAHGLSFSVPTGVKPPPSLRNIFKELHDDCGLTATQESDLSRRAEQGVLLLNSCLSVTLHSPASHKALGREQFTDAIINKLSQQQSGLVFLLWGSFAHSKRSLIDENKHRVFTAAHPSPLSARRGFFGCKHFSQTNDWLVEHGSKPIVW